MSRFDAFSEPETALLTTALATLSLDLTMNAPRKGLTPDETEAVQSKVRKLLEELGYNGGPIAGTTLRGQM